MSCMIIDVTEKQHQALKALLAERLAEAHRGELVQGSIGELAQRALGTQSGK